MYGLPGSGKSTLAAKMCRENGHLVRVNKDLLREMLLCNHWVPKKEKTIGRTALELVRYLLKEGHDVIVDETSLNPIHEQNYRRIADEYKASYELIKMDTPVSVCVHRDAERIKRGERGVGRDVILNMAFQYNIFRSPNTCVVFDMDGTLADCSPRRHFVRNLNGDPNWKKDWKSFFDHIMDDTPRPTVVAELMKAREEGHDVIIVSARPEDRRKVTEDWLMKHSIPHDRIIMRRSGDSRDDTIVKQEIIDTYMDKSKIVRWFDDRPSVIRQVRTNGIQVIDVGQGEEF
ncbi:L-seryl-tRNA(Sec) kinase [uncultured archaeon]|nr:L-seryl-tRNA(Sec) kinase [uncultured archaeon]